MRRLQLNSALSHWRAAGAPSQVTAAADRLEGLLSARLAGDSAVEELDGVAPRNRQVFANAELNLQHIKVVGFDYDYTLAEYNNVELLPWIYDTAKRHLVEKRSYPSELYSQSYDPDFAIRGLHFDERHGTLLKLDELGMVQGDAITFGRQRPSRTECVRMYGEHGTWRVPHGERHRVRLLSDQFSIPEACLIADVIEFFVKQGHKTTISHKFIAEDVREAVSHCHLSGAMYRAVLAEPDRFILRDPHLKPMLQRLRCNGRHVFLLTNSPFWFVDGGMQYLLGNDWRTHFDLIVTSASKPGFYTADSAPFRRLLPHAQLNAESMDAAHLLDLGRVDQLMSGADGGVYVGGSLRELTRLTGWRGDTVLYVGDHLAADIIEPVRNHGWKTILVMKELESELALASKPSVRQCRQDLERIDQLLHAEQLDRQMQQSRAQMLQQESDISKSGTSARESGSTSNVGSRELTSHPEGDDDDDDEEVGQLLHELKVQRKQLRRTLKAMHNPNFGSSLRTYVNHTLFSYELRRYATAYTSRATNILQYPVEHHFYAPPVVMAHDEYSSIGLAQRQLDAELSEEDMYGP